MKKTLFVLAAVVVAYFSFHATAEPVSPAAAASQPALAASVPADASSGAQAPSLPLTIIPDNARHPASVASSSPDNSNRLAALTGFLQSTGEDLPQQSTAETTALSMSAHWGIILLGCSALYMLTIRRNRTPHL